MLTPNNNLKYEALGVYLIVKVSNISYGLIFCLIALPPLLFLAKQASSESDKQMRVLVFGDSIAAGYGLDPSESFPAELQRIVDEKIGPAVKVVNAGLSGETTAGGARRISWVLQQHVDILLIELGGNDALRGLDLKQTEENLISIISAARKRYPSIYILLGGMQAFPNLGPDFASKFQAIYPRIAEQHSVELIPFILEGVGAVKELNQADGIHPTAEGQKLIAKLIWPYLEKAIASKRGAI
jgi:acyl-CoA thioesterase-1